MESLDQLPVTLKHWLVGLCPESLRWLADIFLSIVPILAVFPLIFGITTVIERKGLGRIQNRYGPNRVGPFGFLQFVADGLKMLIKEDIVPRAADKLVHFLAPVAGMIPALLAFSVIPYGRNMIPVDLDTGVLFFFAVGASTELSVFMAGWSSRNKYSLLGAMRAIAQMISYELPLILSAIAVVMMAGSLSTAKIVDAQAGFSGIVPNWFVFTPWGFAGFLLFLTAASAEANRSPFDLPEAESELVAGYFTEYSGFKFAIFFLGEYLGLFAMSGLGITLFLGGWHSPIAALETIVPSWAWFFAKLGALIVLFIWIRGTVPRLRADQLMGLAWKFMLPLALINLFVAGVWHFMTPGLARWLLCAAMIAGPYVVLGRALTVGGGTKRTYRFAE